jgi:hypothetical protein
LDHRILVTLEDWSGGYGSCFSFHLLEGEAMSGLKGGFDSFVGIDVSKDKFDACGITGDEVKLFQFSATMDRKGFEKLFEDRNQANLEYHLSGT